MDTLYLYGVIPAGQAVPEDDRLAAVGSGLTRALVEHVSAEEFLRPDLEDRMKSLEWVAPLARRHEAVLERAMRHGPIIPARLCTLFSGEAKLLETLAEHEARHQATLLRLAGTQEWGVKIFSTEAELRAAIAAEDPQVRAFEAELAAATPGRAFVLRKKMEALVAQRTAEQLDALAAGVFEVVAELAIEARVRPLLSRAVTGSEHAMVLNAAALIAEEDAASFQGAVSALAAPGSIIELSGPWPPYSFAEEEV